MTAIGPRREQPRDRARLGDVLALVHGLERLVGLEDPHLDLDDAVGELALRLEAGPLEDREHLAVLGKNLGGEARHAVRARDDREVLEQDRRDTAALVLIVDGERDFGLATPGPPVVARDADQVVAEERDQRHAVVVVDRREASDVVLAQTRPRAEEPVVDALVREATVEGDKALGIRRPHWPDMDRAAIAEHDIGFPLRGVVAAAHLSERSEDGATRRPCFADLATRCPRPRCARPCRATPDGAGPTRATGSRASSGSTHANVNR